MDGSVSTLAPLFAAAGLTGRPLSAFSVGLAASLGAGISMGLAEALSDDGAVSGRGAPLGRGLITGLATALGGMLHHEFDRLMAAETDDGYSIGFQFHPESILTPSGPQLLERCVNRLLEKGRDNG